MYAPTPDTDSSLSLYVWKSACFCKYEVVCLVGGSSIRRQMEGIETEAFVDQPRSYSSVVSSVAGETVSAAVSSGVALNWWELWVDGLLLQASNGAAKTRVLLLWKLHDLLARERSSAGDFGRCFRTGP